MSGGPSKPAMAHTSQTWQGGDGAAFPAWDGKLPVIPEERTHSNSMGGRRTRRPSQRAGWPPRTAPQAGRSQAPGERATHKGQAEGELGQTSVLVPRVRGDRVRASDTWGGQRSLRLAGQLGRHRACISVSPSASRPETLTAPATAGLRPELGVAPAWV